MLARGSNHKRVACSSKKMHACWVSEVLVFRTCPIMQKKHCQMNSFVATNKKKQQNGDYSTSYCPPSFLWPRLVDNVVQLNRGWAVMRTKIAVFLSSWLPSASIFQSTSRSRFETPLECHWNAFEFLNHAVSLCCVCISCQPPWHALHDNILDARIYGFSPLNYINIPPTGISRPHIVVLC
jgi:hypothetical protein